MNPTGPENNPSLTMLQRETRSSIEVTRNARGDYQWTIKQYHEATGTAAFAAIEDVSIIDARLRSLFLIDRPS